MISDTGYHVYIMCGENMHMTEIPNIHNQMGHEQLQY